MDKLRTHKQKNWQKILLAFSCVTRHIKLDRTFYFIYVYICIQLTIINNIFFSFLDSRDKICFEPAFVAFLNDETFKRLYYYVTISIIAFVSFCITILHNKKNISNEISYNQYICLALVLVAELYLSTISIYYGLFLCTVFLMALTISSKRIDNLIIIFSIFIDKCKRYTLKFLSLCLNTAKYTYLHNIKLFNALIYMFLLSTIIVSLVTYIYLFKDRISNNINMVNPFYRIDSEVHTSNKDFINMSQIINNFHILQYHNKMTINTIHDYKNSGNCYKITKNIDNIQDYIDETNKNSIPKNGEFYRWDNKNLYSFENPRLFRDENTICLFPGQMINRDRELEVYSLNRDIFYKLRKIYGVKGLSYSYNKKIDFSNQNILIQDILLQNWKSPDPCGVWMSNKKSVLRIPVENIQDNYFSLALLINTTISSYDAKNYLRISSNTRVVKEINFNQTNLKQLTLLNLSKDDINKQGYIVLSFETNLDNCGIFLSEGEIFQKDSRENIVFKNIKFYNYIAKALQKIIVSNNYYEIAWQSIMRSEFHHWIYYFFPAYELLQNMNISQICHQYGLGLTCEIALANRLLSTDSKFSINDSVRICVILSIISLLFMSIFSLMLFKNIYTTSIFISSTVFGILLCGFFDHIILSAGISYIRVFFDIPFVYFLFKYLQNKKIIYILCAFIFCAFAIFQDFSFGFLLFASFIAITTLSIIFKDGALNNKIIYLIICLLIAISFSIHAIGTNPISKYFFSGILSFHLSSIQFNFLIVNFIILILFSRGIKNISYKYIYLFSIFYSQSMMLYVVWAGVDTIHKYIYLSRYVFPYIILLQIFFNCNKLQNFVKKICFFVSLLILIISSSCLCKFIDDRNAYYSYFDCHKSYKWNLPGTNFLSTLNPKYFREAKKLIDKYSQKKSIYLISQYDAMLYLISEKLPALPFFYLLDYMATNNELTTTYNVILENKPEYIFIDSDISFPYEYNIIPASLNLWLSKESFYNVLKLITQQNIFAKINELYIPIEKNHLITVYKLK